MLRRSLIPVALSAVLLSLALAPSAGASTTQFTTFDPAISADPKMNRWPSAFTLTDVRALGPRQVKISVNWEIVTFASRNARTRPPAPFNPRDPNTYPAGVWNHYDQLVSQARALGLRILMQVTLPGPNWGTRDKRDGITEPLPAEYGAFVEAVGRRYRGIPEHWSFVNEPNQNAFLRPQRKNGQPYAPKLYRSLYIAALRGMTASGNSTARALIGELAPTGGRLGTTPLAFLRTMFCLDSRYRARGACERAPGQRGGFLPGLGVAQHSYVYRSPFGTPRNQDDVSIASMSRVSRALDLAARAGRVRRGMGVYVTEHGVSTRRPLGASTQQQPEFLAITERIASRNSRVRSYSQFQLFDPKTGSNAFQAGLRNFNTSPRPAYEGWRMPLVVENRRRSVLLWGLVRPARSATTVTIQTCDRSCTRSTARWRTLKSKRTNSRGYWQTTGAIRTGRSWRVTWRDPSRVLHVGPPIRAYRW